MPKCFDWKDYELSGPLTISLGDYTIRAFGCEGIIKRLMRNLAASRQRNESIRWILMGYWGRGKSTLMYNFCHAVNGTMFFSPNPSPTLALYVKYPRKPVDLLDPSYENGLAVPWSSFQDKGDAQTLRWDLFRSSLRILAYGLAKEALSDKSYSKSVAEVLPTCGSRANESIIELIECVDNSGLKNVYEPLARAVLPFVNESIEEYAENPIPRDWLNCFSGLFFPEPTRVFISSFSKLFEEPGRGLRNFLIFHRLFELANIHILVVIDEAEDWDYMAKTKLDEFLKTILPTHRLSVVLILRTEVGKRLRGLQKKFKFYYIKSFMESVQLNDPDSSEVLQIAKGVLSTCRLENSLKLLPFSEQFVIELSKLTVRGKHFNSRLFLRTLDKILKISLSLERESVVIPEDFINRRDLLDSLAENLKTEDSQEAESSPLSIGDELNRKIGAAQLIGQCLLNGEVIPPSKYMFRIVKEVVSDVFGTPILSDTDVLTYASDEEREKIFRMINELREITVSKRAVISLKERFRDSLDAS